MAKKKIEAEVVALGSSNSDLTKATALEAKISKADMTNIIQQEVNESIYKAIKDLEGTLALIKIEEGALLKEVEKKILSIYINAAKETYPNINIKEEDIHVIVTVDGPHHGGEWQVKANGCIKITPSSGLTSSIYKAKTQDSLITSVEPRHNGYSNDGIVISLPDFYYITKGLKGIIERARNVKNEIATISIKRDRVTAAGYMRAQLDKSILAGTKGGDQVVKNIALLTEVLIKEANLPKLGN
jgi:hypothetical protein